MLLWWILTNCVMLYHIVRQDHWDKFKDAFLYFSETFEQEGFIHFSKESQVFGVLERYYKNEDNLVLLSIDESKLTSELRFEKSTNNEIYPHLYGGLNRDAIIQVSKGTAAELSIKFL